MSFRARIFLGFLFVGSIALYQLASWAVRDMKPGYRKATEEQLVETAEILAALAETAVRDGRLQVDIFEQLFANVRKRELKAPIYDFLKSSVELRIYITDAAGKLIYDSRSATEVGEDYAEWRDVKLVLKGEYGSRTTKEGDEDDSVMYVAAPIRNNGELLGVLSVGKPTKNVNLFVLQARSNVFFGGAAVLAAVILVGFILSHMVSSPVMRLTGYARAVRDGVREPMPRLGNGELRVLGEAFEEMRESLEGKRYIERYVETLTHELKSPLAAVAGAVELLRGGPPAEDRIRFLENIGVETDRMKSVIDQLLLLSVIEAKKTLNGKASFDPRLLCDEVLSELGARIHQKEIRILREDLAEKLPTIMGDRTLLKEALRNVLQNAVDFSPVRGTLGVKVAESGNGILYEVSDQGPGVPDYAIERVFERFYSLPRPDTGKKSSGLGLSIVREIAELHGGAVSLRNREEGGAVVKLFFPSGR